MIIKQASGSVVKFIGDSVLAYFLDPEMALEAAVRIQERFQSHNQGKGPKSRIHIRLCIHYGEGIIEKNDIFGDVVNMAAKLLAMADGDQIFISGQLFEKVKDFPGLNFKPVATPKEKSILIGFKAYQVIWNTKPSTDAAIKTCLYIRPCWTPGERTYEKNWENLLSERDVWWEDRSEHKSMLPDGSMVLIGAETGTAVSLGRNVLYFLSGAPEGGPVPLTPVRIVIDSGDCLKADGSVLDDFKARWDRVQPGYIHVSSRLRSVLPKDRSYAIVPLKGRNPLRSFYKLILKDQEENDPLLFQYQDFLTTGNHPPCYYCGDRRHETGRCPSKHLPETTHALERLGYLSSVEINGLFHAYLMEKSLDFQIDPHTLNGKDEAVHDVYYGFFELKKVFQLRMLKTLWNSRADSWNKVMQSGGSGEKGGLIWLGQDCVRVSNLDRAESIIRGALKKNPHDYKAHCINGFLNIERRNLAGAKFSLEEALNNASCRVQKIFAHFLICRIYEILNDDSMAWKSIRSILALDPYCYEASYREILYLFRQDRPTEALSRLSRLVKKDRSYYLYALIDPELAPYTGQIHPLLKEFLQKARMDAQQACNRAEEAIKKMKELCRKEETGMSDVLSLWSKIEQLSKKGGYFSFLDIIHYCATIEKMARRSIEDQRFNLVRLLNDLKSRYNAAAESINRFPYPYFTQNLSRRLKRVESEMNGHLNTARASVVGNFRDAMAQCLEISNEMNQIGSELKRLEALKRLIQFVILFLRKNLIIQSANLIAGILLFPVITHYLGYVAPRFNLTPNSFWIWQKTILILGGLTGVILSFITSANRMLKD